MNTIVALAGFIATLVSCVALHELFVVNEQQQRPLEKMANWNIFLRQMENWSSSSYGKSQFELTGQQAAQLRVVAKYHNLLKKEVPLKNYSVVHLQENEVGSRMLQFATGYNFGSFIVLAVTGLWGMLCGLLHASFTMKLFVIVLLTLGCLIFFAMMFWIRHLSSNSDGIDAIAPLNKESIPILFIGNQTLYGLEIRDLDLLYRVNVMINPVSKRPFLESLKSVKPTDSDFWAMGDLLQKMNKDEIHAAFSDQSDIGSQVDHFNQEYHDFLEKLLKVWLDLTIKNRLQYQQQLMVKGDTDKMDAETRQKYFSNAARVITEMKGNKK